MSQEDLIEAISLWSKQITDDAAAHQLVLHPPKPPPPPHVPIHNLNLCDYCASNKTCQKDSDGIVRSNSNTDDCGIIVDDCPKFEPLDTMPKDIPCWFCGQVNCDDVLTVTAINFGLLNRHILNDNLKHVDRPIHDACYDLYFSDEAPKSVNLQVIPSAYECEVINYIKGESNGNRHQNIIIWQPPIYSAPIICEPSVGQIVSQVTKP